MNCHATTTSPIPRSHLHALRDPNWHKAMIDKYNALISNGTWALVPRPANVNIVRSMCLFNHKFNADGSLSIAPFFVWGPLTSSGGMVSASLLASFTRVGLCYLRTKFGLFLSQSKFEEEILERASHAHCNQARTPGGTLSPSLDLMVTLSVTLLYIAALQVLFSI
ncbi:ribonuclease H-like domain-containing protein [Tanacetum coccineum]|uniref:Ribonuclease H-like domain-containing protein n=1 Tax=Tanacetum coccineum TaxID=301880 RepID=A0ABQ4XAQ6_9ASTR